MFVEEEKYEQLIFDDLVSQEDYFTSKHFSLDDTENRFWRMRFRINLTQSSWDFIYWPCVL